MEKALEGKNLKDDNTYAINYLQRIVINNTVERYLNLSNAISQK